MLPVVGWCIYKHCGFWNSNRADRPVPGILGEILDIDDYFKIFVSYISLQERVWSSTDQADGTVPMDNKPTTGETVVPDPAPPKNE